MTYIPPVNGGRINATISGNTSGAGALVSTGTMALAGGNNITLSQNGNTITISGAAAGAAGSNSFGMSNIGNTLGTTGMVSGSAVRFAFAGGNNVTLSQSINASSGTITISAANQSVQTQNLFNMSLSGNTSGAMAQVSSGTLTLAGGNNVTLSQNGNAVTISAASQSVQTQNLHNVSLAGNTAGVLAHVSSGTLTLAGGNNITLSQNGNAITISGGAGGAGGGVALANSQATFSTGTVNILEGGGAITIASSAGGQSLKLSVPGTSSLVGANGIGVSAGGSTITIDGSGINTAGATLSYFNPLDAYVQVAGQQGQATLHVQPAYAPNVTFDRIAMPVVFSGATSVTASVTLSMWMGIYTRNASTLSLMTSYSVSNSLLHSGTANSSQNVGLKILTMGASSSLSGGQYFIGIMSRTTSGGSNASISQIVVSQQASNYGGLWGQVSSATQQYTAGLGVYTVSTTGVPSSIALSQLNGTASMVLRQPVFYLVNGTF